MWVSQAEYARRRGVGRQYVNRLVRSGKIPVSKNGRIDPAKADAALDALRDPSRGKNGSPVKAGQYAQARLQREVYQALLKKLEYEKLKGKLLDRDEVLKTWATAFINLRAALDRIPAKCCSRCRDTVDAAIGAELEALSDAAIVDAE